MAAQQRALVVAESSPRSTRFVALTTGTLGLLAFGMLIVTVTPKRAESPVAISATTTPVTTDHAVRAVAGLAPPANDRVGLQAPTTHLPTTGVLATPIGDGRFALITRRSIVDTRRSIIDVRLPSGRTSAGSIVSTSDDAIVVALATIEPGRDIARHRPESDDLVTVMASPPILIEYDEVDTLTVEEGTAVLDDNGHLIGICSRLDDSDQVRLIEISPALDAAASAAP